MQAQATLVAQQRLNVLTLPIAAVSRIGGVSTVEVKKQDGSIEKVTVTTGLSNNRSIEILSGLEEGQTVLLPEAPSPSTSGGSQGGSKPGEIIIGPGGGPKVEFFQSGTGGKR